MAETESKNVDFLIGSDLELVFLEPNGKLVGANRILIDPNHRNPLGCDGHPEIAEMRPGPGTPQQLVGNIAQIIRDYHKHHVPEQLRWAAGSFVGEKNIGGHIHFGFTYRDHYGDVLDGVLSQVLTLLEDQDEARARRAGPYGKLVCQVGPEGQRSDAVRFPEGTREQHLRFEYRTPASFIVSPGIALGVFGLAKAIMWEEKNNGRFRIRRLRKHDFLPLLKIDLRRWQQADRDHFLQKLPPLWKLISRYCYWKTPEGREMWPHACHVRHIAANYPNWYNGHDIIQRWKFATETRIIKSRLYKPIELPREFPTEQDAWMVIANAFAQDTPTLTGAQAAEPVARVRPARPQRLQWHIDPAVNVDVDATIDAIALRMRQMEAQWGQHARIDPEGNVQWGVAQPERPPRVPPEGGP